LQVKSKPFVVEFLIKASKLGLFWFLRPIWIKLSLTANIVLYVLYTVHLTIIYLHEIVTIPNIPRKARGSDWNLSQAGSGPRAGLCGPLLSLNGTHAKQNVEKQL